MRDSNYLKFVAGMLLLIFSLHLEHVNAQKSILERSVSLQINDKKINLVLKEIESKGNFIFSYNPDLIPADSLISIAVTQKTIRQILIKIFGESIKYNEKGNYIILQKSTPPIQVANQKKIIYTISGYVEDKQTGEKIPYASLYEQTTLKAAISDQYGFYQLQLPPINIASYKLNISKENYGDTLIIVRPLINYKLDISISPLLNEIKIIAEPTVLDSTNFTNKILVDSVATDIRKSKLANFLLSTGQKFQSANIKQYFNKGWQVSLFPGLSTNGTLNSNIVNDYSFNLFGGFSGGTNKIEIGGFINIDKTNVNGVQMAGFTNIVGGSTVGLQLAGFSNTVLKSTQGVQFAGFTNIVTDTLKGAQFAGFCNIIKGHTTGLQAAGFCNVVTKNMNGIQLAGFTNITVNDLNSCQIAGFANYAKNTKGLQVAGFMNITSKKMEGIQLSGFINYASEMQGTQVGFINIAKKAEGIPIGFFSFVSNGFHKFEFSTNNIVPANLSFKTGVKQFYNIFSAGYNPSPNKKIFTYGYGIGHEFNMSKKLGLDLEAISNQVYLGKWNDFNLWNHANLSLAWNINPHFTLFAGPTVNYSITKKIKPISDDSFADNFIPSYATNIKNNSKNYNTNAWIGFNVGLRIW